MEPAWHLKTNLTHIRISMDRDDFLCIIWIVFIISVVIILCYVRDSYEYELAKKHFPGMTKLEYLYLKPKIIAVPEGK